MKTSLSAAFSAASIKASPKPAPENAAASPSDNRLANPQPVFAFPTCFFTRGSFQMNWTMLTLFFLGGLSLLADDKSPSAKFEGEIRAYEAADKKSPPPEGAVLFVGASGIRLWKTLEKDFP